eukprot:GSChrysophyteH1.ASY1.ANO1.704.1 assembled CDS
MKWFLTVGTTSFDPLIRAIDCADFLNVAVECGCESLVIQVGRGEYLPVYLSETVCAQRGVKFTCFRFKPTLCDEMEAADLIISHGGAGSILEAMTLKKLLVVVVNNSLQENHQVELADAMSSRNYCLQALPENIMDVIRGIGEKLSAKSGKSRHHTRRHRSQEGDFTTLIGLDAYPDANLNAFPSLVDNLFASPVT